MWGHPPVETQLVPPPVSSATRPVSSAGRTGDSLTRMLSEMDRQPSKAYPAAVYAQDEELVSWSPLAQAGGSWQLFRESVGEDPGCAAAVGSLLGLAIGDALGAPLEFLPVNPHLDYGESNERTRERRPCLLQRSGELNYCHPFNKFKAKPGQWTDDCSMALCLADSMLVQGDYHGGDARVRWHMWWAHGYCNAFRHDAERSRGQTSVGLGGNISQSLKQLERGISPDAKSHAEAVSPIFNSQSEDAGNGSIMRLAPVPIAFHGNTQRALEVAELQSMATHPSPDASACCRFMAFFIVRAVNAHQDGRNPGMNVQEFMDQQIHDYLSSVPASEHSGRGHGKLHDLLLCRPPSDTEANWDWKRRELGIDEAIHARRSTPSGTYNGYPVIPTYFGSYCMDGLAMALWALWWSTDFASCLLLAVNLLGDADTIGAIAGQMAGAVYSLRGIDASEMGRRCLENLRVWDPVAEIGLRAVLLYRHGPGASRSDRPRAIAPAAPIPTPSARSALWPGGHGGDVTVVRRPSEDTMEPPSRRPSKEAVVLEPPSRRPSKEAVVLTPKAVTPPTRSVMLKQAEGHGGVRIFAEPRTGAVARTELPSGTYASAFEDQGSFVRIRRNSVDGWVGAKNCVAVPPVDIDSYQVPEDDKAPPMASSWSLQVNPTHSITSMTSIGSIPSVCSERRNVPFVPPSGTPGVRVYANANATAGDGQAPIIGRATNSNSFGNAAAVAPAADRSTSFTSMASTIAGHVRSFGGFAGAGAGKTSPEVVLKQAEGHTSVRMFAQPKTGAAVIGEIPNGQRMVLGAKEGSFVQVSSGNVSGWVGAKNIADTQKKKTVMAV